LKEWKEDFSYTINHDSSVSLQVFEWKLLDIGEHANCRLESATWREEGQKELRLREKIAALQVSLHRAERYKEKYSHAKGVIGKWEQKYQRQQRQCQESEETCRLEEQHSLQLERKWKETVACLEQERSEHFQSREELVALQEKWAQTQKECEQAETRYESLQQSLQRQIDDAVRRAQTAQKEEDTAWIQRLLQWIATTWRDITPISLVETPSHSHSHSHSHSSSSSSSLWRQLPPEATPYIPVLEDIRQCSRRLVQQMQLSEAEFRQQLQRQRERMESAAQKQVATCKAQHAAELQEVQREKCQAMCGVESQWQRERETFEETRRQWEQVQEQLQGLEGKMKEVEAEKTMLATEGEQWKESNDAAEQRLLMQQREHWQEMESLREELKRMKTELKEMKATVEEEQKEKEKQKETGTGMSAAGTSGTSVVGPPVVVMGPSSTVPMHRRRPASICYVGEIVADRGTQMEDSVRVEKGTQVDGGVVAAIPQVPTAASHGVQTESPQLLLPIDERICIRCGLNDIYAPRCCAYHPALTVHSSGYQPSAEELQQCEGHSLEDDPCAIRNHHAYATRMPHQPQTSLSQLPFPTGNVRQRWTGQPHFQPEPERAPSTKAKDVGKDKGKISFSTLPLTSKIGGDSKRVSATRHVAGPSLLPGDDYHSQVQTIAEEKEKPITTIQLEDYLKIHDDYQRQQLRRQSQR
jgi:hypothetical protein